MPDTPVAIVTGASRGIGRAGALALAEAGFDVVVSSRTVKEGEGVAEANSVREDRNLSVPGSLERTAQEVEERGRRALIVPLDLMDRESVVALPKRVLEEWGRVDVLFNNAVFRGVGNLDRIEDLTPQSMMDVFTGNFIHQILLIQGVLPHMKRARQRGHRQHGVRLGALGSARPPGEGGWGIVYSGSKAAFGRVAGGMNAEHLGSGIKTYNLDPGNVITEARKVVAPQDEYEDEFGNDSAEATGKVVAWLATDPGAEQVPGQVDLRAQALLGSRAHPGLDDGGQQPRIAARRLPEPGIHIGRYVSSDHDARQGVDAWRSATRLSRKRCATSSARTTTSCSTTPDGRGTLARSRHRPGLQARLEADGCRRLGRHRLAEGVGRPGPHARSSSSSSSTSRCAPARRCRCSTINSVGADDHAVRHARSRRSSTCRRSSTGEIHFAIGYTEPDAGTDLASLKTRAVRDGDEYVINGQKIFTSLASDADYIWLAVRTEPEVKKHKGISIIIVPDRHARLHATSRSTTSASTNTNITLLRRRARAGRQPRRRGERGLEPHHQPAQPRARHAVLVGRGRAPARRRARLGAADEARRRPPRDRPGVGAGQPGPRARQARVPAPRQLEGRVARAERRAR